MKEYMRPFVAIRDFFSKFFKKYTVWRTTDPFVVSYKNLSDSPKKAVVFGCNEYEEWANFGTDKEVTVEVHTSVPYIQLLRQSKYAPFVISGIRIMFERENKFFYLTKNLSYFWGEKDGNSFSQRVVLLTQYDLYQFAEDMVDVCRFNGKKIDGDTQLGLTIAPKSTLAIAIYPKREVKVGYFKYRKILNKARKNKK